MIGVNGGSGVGRGGRGGARNVIVLIGDGMGHAHRLGGQLVSAGRYGRLAMDSLPYAGVMNTLSADPSLFVTDSAAAATAVATGVKTSNGAISVDLDGLPRTTILELARHAGKLTGLVTTCQVTDATPAAFAAHVPHRSDQSEIARQYIEETSVDVILGGGAAHWLPVGAEPLFSINLDLPGSAAEASRGNAGDLLRRAEELGYVIATTPDSLRRAADDPETTRLLGLFANQELFRQFPEGRGDKYDPPVSLAELTASALAVLSRHDRGFFLMVEESAIDRMAHRNNAPLTLKGVIELDRAVSVAIAFAEQLDDTLVVVTADHECGGLAIAGSDDPPYPYEPGGGLLDGVLAGEDGPFPVLGTDQGFVMGWATTGHTAASVPVTALGPGAEALVGVYENTHLFDVLADALGVGPLIEQRFHRRSGFSD